MTPIAETLAFAGVLLFLLGLLNGFAIPVLRSPRLGLSAHLTGVQSGTFLIATGLLWSEIGVWPAWEQLLGDGLWMSLFSLWLSLLLAGALGAGRGLPIAGQGIRTGAIGQGVVSVLLAGGLLGTTGSVAAILVAWWMSH